MIRFQRWRFTWLGCLVAVALLGGGGFGWYQVTRPDHRLKQGQEALLAGDSQTAEELADRLQASGYPDHAHLLRGQVYLHRHRLDEAVLEYNQIRPENEAVLVEASLLYGLAFLSIGEATRAEKLFLHVTENWPDNVDARRGLSVIYYDRGAMSKAVKQLEKWSELDDGDGQPHRFMATIFKDLGADEPAVQHYQAALARRLAPAVREDVTLELAEAFNKRIQYAEALTCLDECPFATPRAQAEAAELRAASLYGLNRVAEATDVLESLLRAGSPSPRALRLRAQIYTDANDPKAAVPLLEKALRADPHEPACRYQLAMAYEALGRHQEAGRERRLLDETQKLFTTLGDLSREADSKPTDVQVRRRMAEVCEQLGRFQLAQTWRRAAESCRPQE